MSKSYWSEANQEESANSLTTSTDSENIFALTEPYSDEIEIKQVISKIINKIEIEEQESLVNRPNFNLQTSASTNNQASSKGSKRKLNEINQNQDFLTILSQNEHKIKLFDPLNEHFSWCPWLQPIEIEHNLNSLTTNAISLLFKTNDARTKTRLINKNVCHFYFEIVNTISTSQTKKFKMARITDKSQNSSTTSENDKTSESERSLINKVKSIKSLLIDCASQLIDK